MYKLSYMPKQIKNINIYWWLKIVLRYVWVVPMKNKTGSAVGEVMERVLKQQTSNNLQSLAALEFFNKNIEK